MRKGLLLSIFLWGVVVASAQQIQGQLTQYTNQSIRLESFSGFKTYLLDSVVTDASGRFSLAYKKSDYGMGVLIDASGKSFLLILSGENIVIKGNDIADTKSIEVVEGKENKIFGQYASDYARREQALSAWAYLDKLYTSDTLFSAHKAPKLAIEKERNRIVQEDITYLASLSKESYVSWLIPVRKLISSVQVVTKYRPEEIPATISAFRKLDYADARLYKSGLLRDAIEAHFWLIENGGFSLDAVYAQMKVSIDALLVNLYKDEAKLNEITNHLFKWLEQRSLFVASEHLSMKVLENKSCTLDGDLQRKLESYRGMKRGAIAPDFAFSEVTLSPGYDPSTTPQRLSSLKSKYALVVFGASWCPQCTEELPKIAANYLALKQKGVEVVYVSLDTDKESFNSFAKSFPFISTCDFKKWDGPIASDYFVFATPTMYLLDTNRQIILRPANVEQLQGWMGQN